MKRILFFGVLVLFTGSQAFAGLDKDLVVFFSFDNVKGKNLDGTVRAETSITSGTISSDIPIQVQGLLTEDKLKGTLNGGGPLLKLRASLGKIRVKGRK